MVEDHYIHFFFLGAPDFVVGPQAPAAERNILGVIAKVGMEIAGQVIRVRKMCREIMQTLADKVVHPVFGLPGGVSRGMSEEEREKFMEIAKFAVEFAQFALQLFGDVILKNKEYVDLVLSDTYSLRTYYMGLVDDNDKVNFYDGKVRVVDPEGREVAKFVPREYVDYIREHIEP